MSKQTLAIIKPDAVKKDVVGKIITMITESGFRIKGLRYMKLTDTAAGAFYKVHKERPFYNDLIKYMTSGPVVAIALDKDHAVEDYRKLIGATDPEKAEAGTVRNLFGSSIEANAVHGSDSDENAANEIAFFFSENEIVNVL